jgi:low affinity Fe/Cu permease
MHLARVDREGEEVLRLLKALFFGVLPMPPHDPLGTASHRESLLARFSRLATDWSGSSLAFGLACLTIIVWLVSGPFFNFTDTWQLVINTGTTIVTFLMVFLIQRAQNKDSHAIHLKLNELVAAMRGASNRLINVENLTEGEINTLHEHYAKLVELAKADGKLTQSHSVEEATDRHHRKKSGKK